MRRNPSPSVILSIIAVVLATSGAAVATSLVGGDTLIRLNSLSGDRLRDHSVAGSKINFRRLGPIAIARSPGVLKTGRSLVGAWAIGGEASGAGDTAATAITFTFPLAQPPAPNLIPAGSASTTQCPGTAANPRAAPGNLCVYAAVSSPAVATLSLSDPGTGQDGVGSRVGEVVRATAGSSGSFRAQGTWAVTAP